MNRQQKQQLRRQLRDRRRSLSPQQQQHAAFRAMRHLQRLALFRRAHHIAAYLANDGEIGTEAILCRIAHTQKQLYLPVIHARRDRVSMAFHRYRPRQHLGSNRYGIAEPGSRRLPQRAPHKLDVVLMPLVGFDRRGKRLGMGGGFYDRALPTRTPQRPATPRSGGAGPQLPGGRCNSRRRLGHPADAIITERGVIWISRP